MDAGLLSMKLIQIARFPLATRRAFPLLLEGKLSTSQNMLSSSEAYSSMKVAIVLEEK